MGRAILTAIAAIVMLAMTSASFYLPQLEHSAVLPTTAEKQPIRPVTIQNNGLISIDFIKNATKDPGTGRLSSSWDDMEAGGRIMTDNIYYLGFKYQHTNHTVSGSQGLYYTGESDAGRHIYVSPGDMQTSRIPDSVYLQDGANYTQYNIAEKPPIYAYTLCGAYNTNETVAFGLADDSGGAIDLPNAAPYQIQKKGDSGWVTVFSPQAAQVIVSMENGTSRDWEWDQRLDDGSPATFGEYRAIINGKYITGFRIAGDTPTVKSAQVDYTAESADEAFSSPPEARSFIAAYNTAADKPDLRADLISIMQFKAMVKKLDPNGLGPSISRTGDNEGLPCLAVSTKYRGWPAWILVFAMPGNDAAMGARYYAISNGAVLHAGPLQA